MKTIQFSNNINNPISVSTICGSHSKLFETINIITENNVYLAEYNFPEITLIHNDIMDGHFVPRYGIYPEILQELRQSFPAFIHDFHLMTDDVCFTLDQFASVIKENDYINFHLETNERNIFYILDKINDMGAKPGIVLNLSSNIYDIDSIYQYISTILFMGIHPGVLKQTAKPDLASNKLSALKKLYDFHGRIQIDGGVSFNTVNRLYRSGFTDFVCGSSTVFKNLLHTDSYENRKQLILNNTIEFYNQFIW